MDKMTEAIVYIILFLIVPSAVAYGLYFLNRRNKPKPVDMPAVVPISVTNPLLPSILKAAQVADPLMTALGKMRVSKEEREIDAYFDSKMRNWLLTHREEIRRLIG